MLCSIYAQTLKIIASLSIYSLNMIAILSGRCMTHLETIKKILTILSPFVILKLANLAIMTGGVNDEEGQFN